MSSNDYDNSNNINGNKKIEYEIKIPDNWNERCDENNFYKVSEVKKAGDLQYQDIRPLTPKRLNNAEKNEERKISNNSNYSENHEIRNEGNDGSVRKISKDEVKIISIFLYS